MDKLTKHKLPSVADLKLDIDLDELRAATNKLAGEFKDVRSANPMLCDNHMELVKSLKSSKIIKYAFIALIGSIALAISSKVKILDCAPIPVPQDVVE